MTNDPPLNTADQPPSGRDAAGRFVSGPANIGRVVGSKNLLSRNALTAVQNLASLAILKLRERINAGDMAAIKLCLEYTLPRDGRTIDLGTTDPLAVADACAMGEISPGECDKIASAYGKLQDIHALEDVTKRVDEIEHALAAADRNRR